MKTSWLHNNDCRQLILFCNGWGMDGNPFRHMAGIEYDVYMLYDYKRMDLPKELAEILPRYEAIHLIAWSIGVWAGQKLFAGQRSIFDRTLALNGTLCPIHDRYGIPEEIYAETLNGFCEAARYKFYRRMCREKSNLRSFLSKQPQRPLEDQHEELAALREMADCTPVDDSLYKEVVIAEYDWIVPSENQRNFWQDRPVALISGFHYLFNLWQSWDHLLSFTESAPQIGERREARLESGKAM